MIFDKENLFSDGQAITATANSTNVVDLGVNRDIGKGVPVPIVIQVTEDFAGLDTLAATIETSSTEDFAISTTLATSGDIDVSELVAGYQFPLQYMPLRTERYLRVVYTAGGEAGTAGRVTAGVVAAHQHGF